MTNWLENLCSQMDPADQPFGPTASVFLKQSRGLEMHRDKVHPKAFTNSQSRQGK